MADEQATLVHASDDQDNAEGCHTREAEDGVAQDEPEAVAAEGAREEESGAASADKKARKGRVEVPYTIPAWSASPSVKFQLEVLKNGSVLGDLDM